MLIHFLLERMTMTCPFYAQLINLFAALLLLLAFAMLTQRRILSLINLFAAQGFVLVLSTLRRRLLHAARGICTIPRC